MTLPSPALLAKLRREFVVGWCDITGEDGAGDSFGYTRDQPAVGTTNGAGPHNLQLFVLAPDLTVLHALPGFWHPEDLRRELDLGLRLLDVWNDPELCRAQKDAAFARMQLAAAAGQSAAATARSAWQSFDAADEHKRLARGRVRDTVVAGTGASPQSAALKPLDRLTHERMARQPFVAFGEFDVAALVDYGYPFYDNNKRVSGRGRSLAR